jgi:multiple sugar transport system substrate-binding protein
MTARFAAHNPPDVFYVDSSVLPAWSTQKVLQPLNSYITGTKYNIKKFYPGLLNAFKVGKTYYGFPKDWSPLATEINRSMFAKAGITRLPRTWAQLTADAQKLASSNAVPGGKPICLPADWARMLAFIYQNKGSLSNVQSLAVRTAVNFYVGLIKRGLAATPQQLGAGWPGEALGKQKAAIIFEGNWLLPYMKSTFPQVSYGVGPMVKGKVNGNLGFTVSYSMAKDSKHKAAAWTLLSWLTGKAGMTLWMSKGLALPSRTDVKAVGGRKAFLAAGPFAHGWGFPNFSATQTIMNNDLQAVINGSMSVNSMLSDVAKSLKG